MTIQVLVHEQVKELPERLVLSRWTMGASSGIGHATHLDSESSSYDVSMRRNIIYMSAMDILTTGADSADAFNFFLKAPSDIKTTLIRGNEEDATPQRQEIIAHEQQCKTSSIYKSKIKGETPVD